MKKTPTPKAPAAKRPTVADLQAAEAARDDIEKTLMRAGMEIHAVGLSLAKLCELRKTSVPVAELRGLADVIRSIGMGAFRRTLEA